MKRVFISDCEGPISKNDNAFELASHFIPNGDRIFTVISKYDDALADVLKRRNYKAGNTLKLILPFLKAYGVTDERINEFSRKHLVLIRNVKEALKHVCRIARAYIVSTSYEHYLKALCKALEFPFENTYCTRLTINKYSIIEEEKTQLKRLAEKISKMPTIEISPNSKTLKDFSPEDRRTIMQLDKIFWEEIKQMKIGEIFETVNPVGGSEKAKAVKEITESLGATLADVMYVGDSITDEEAFRAVKENDGLTVSFNGNQYAVENAEIAVLSETSYTTAVIADIFCRFGKKQTLDLVENWSRQSLEKSVADRALLDRLFTLYPGSLPKAKIITRQNMQTLIRESSDFRKKVRGEAIGTLG